MIRKGDMPMEEKRKRGAGRPRAGRAAPAALAACLCALAVALLAWGPWAQPAPGGGGEPDAGQAAVADGEGPDGPPADEGPGGEGVLDPNDFEDDAAYERALIESGSPRVKVPRVPVSEKEEGERYDHGYYECIVVAHFDLSAGEERAREAVEALGGVWVSDTFSWPSSRDAGEASAMLYFEGATTREQLEAICAELRGEDFVNSANPNGWFESCAADQGAEAASVGGYPVNDELAVSQFWLSASGFRRAWEAVRCSGTVEVAVLDSGIDLDHPDLADNLGTTMPYDAYNQTVQRATPATGP